MSSLILFIFLVLCGYAQCIQRRKSVEQCVHFGTSLICKGTVVRLSEFTCTERIRKVVVVSQLAFVDVTSCSNLTRVTFPSGCPFTLTASMTLEITPPACADKLMVLSSTTSAIAQVAADQPLTAAESRQTVTETAVMHTVPAPTVTDPPPVVTEPPHTVTEPPSSSTERPSTTTSPLPMVTVEPSETVTEALPVLTKPPPMNTDPPPMVTEPPEMVTQPRSSVAEPIRQPSSHKSTIFHTSLSTSPHQTTSPATTPAPSVPLTSSPPTQHKPPRVSPIVTQSTKIITPRIVKLRTLPEEITTPATRLIMQQSSPLTPPPPMEVRPVHHHSIDIPISLGSVASLIAAIASFTIIFILFKQRQRNRQQAAAAQGIELQPARPHTSDTEESQYAQVTSTTSFDTTTGDEGSDGEVSPGQGSPDRRPPGRSPPPPPPPGELDPAAAAGAAMQRLNIADESGASPSLTTRRRVRRATNFEDEPRATTSQRTLRSSVRIARVRQKNINFARARRMNTKLCNFSSVREVAEVHAPL